MWIELYLYAGFGGHEGFGREGALFAFGRCDLPGLFARIAQPEEIIRGRQDCLEAYIIRQLIVIACHERQTATIDTHPRLDLQQGAASHTAGGILPIDKGLLAAMWAEDDMVLDGLQEAYPFCLDEA